MHGVPAAIDAMLPVIADPQRPFPQPPLLGVVLGHGKIPEFDFDRQ